MHWSYRGRLQSYTTLLCVLMLAGLTACDRGDLDQSSPQAVIDSARTLVVEGRPEQLTDLVWAESDEMRGVLDALGRVLGRLDELAETVQAKFPEDLKAMKAKAEEAAASGKAGSLVSRLGTTIASGGRGRRGSSGGGGGEDLVNQLAKQLLSDPYAFLASESAKITTTPISDDRVAILYEDKPIIPIIGLTMQRRDGQWFVVLPTTFPRVGNVLPTSAEGWEVMGSLMEVFDSALADTTNDIAAGKARTLDEVSRLLGEKAFVPAAMVFFAYSKIYEEQKKTGKPSGG
jgi:hypothetical protein